MRVDMRVGEDWAIARRGIYKAQIVLRIPEEIKERLEEKAKEKGLRVSDLVRLAILKWLNEEEK
jgi:predicted DNA-binding protein